jgi:hypothetical protein
MNDDTRNAIAAAYVLAALVGRYVLLPALVLVGLVYGACHLLGR